MHYLFKPSVIEKKLQSLLKFTLPLSVILIITSLAWVFLKAPDDYIQGFAAKIMYIHVPSAWMTMLSYAMMVCFSIAYVIWKSPISSMLAEKTANVGVIFCITTLITGSIWGKPMWGTWWVWDARLTSMMILLFIFIAYIILQNSFENKFEAYMPAAIFCIFGGINLPIIKFSVDIWNSLHQPASILRYGGPKIHSSMLVPLILMMLGFLFYFLTILNIKIKSEFLKNKINKEQRKIINSKVS